VHLSEGIKGSIQYGDSCTPMFITVLFTLAKLWNRPRIPSKDEQIKKTWKHNGVLFGHKEDRNNVICKKIDGIGDNR
jgi:hypothetical protein